MKRLRKDRANNVNIVLNDTDFEYEEEVCVVDANDLQPDIILKKAKAMVIKPRGKSKRPRTFNNVKKLPLMYKNQPKAWMIAALFTSGMTKFSSLK